jgi:hypothetical protein
MLLKKELDLIRMVTLELVKFVRKTGFNSNKSSNKSRISTIYIEGLTVQTIGHSDSSDGTRTPH